VTLKPLTCGGATTADVSVHRAVDRG